MSRRGTCRGVRFRRKHVEPELAVGALGEAVGLARRNLDPVHDELEVLDHRLDRVVDPASLSGLLMTRVVHHDRSGLDLVECLPDDADRSGVARPPGRGSDRNSHRGFPAARRTRTDRRPDRGNPCERRSRPRWRAARAGEAPGDASSSDDRPDLLHSTAEDVVVGEQGLALVHHRRGSLAEQREQLVAEVVRQVVGDAADAHVRVRQARALHLDNCLKHF